MKPVPSIRLFSSIKRLFCLALAVTTMALAGCGGESTGEGSKVLKVGVMAGPEAELMKVALDKASRDSGLQAELVEFQDYIAPNTALADGSIDVNAFQHRPYLDSMVEDRGLKLAAVANTFVYPIAAYSDKIKTLDELKQGARIAIPNDPSNEGRTLILMHNSGLIVLEDPANLEATPRDIINNPKQLQFNELDAAQLPRVLPDVDLAFVNNTYAVPAGLTLERAVLIEGKKSPYVNLIVARLDNKNDPRIARLVEAYQSQAVIDKARALFQGAAVKGW